MSWYYAVNNERLGPVDEPTFETLVREGKITPQTLVWRTGMADWQPYSQATALAAGPEPGFAGGSSTECSECRGTFPPDEMIILEGRSVCPDCKPLFVQKMREGTLLPGDRVYAGFWVRLVAKFLDGMILQLANWIVILGLAQVLAAETANNVGTFFGVLLGIAFNTYFVGKFNATPGKMALRLRVIRADGAPVGYGLAAGRYFAEILSAITLLIGYIMAGFDEEKRALHDRICHTRVVRE